MRGHVIRAKCDREGGVERLVAALFIYFLVSTALPPLFPRCCNAVATVQQSSPQDTAEFTQRLCFHQGEAGSSRGAQSCAPAALRGTIQRKQAAQPQQRFSLFNYYFLLPYLDVGWRPRCLQSLLAQSPVGGQRSVGGVCEAANG